MRLGVTTPVAFFPLSIGSLIALNHQNLFQTKFWDTIGSHRNKITLILCALYGTYWLLNVRTSHFNLLGDTILYLAFGMFVYNAKNGTTGITGVILDNSFLRYIGRISYGLYVYHMIAPNMTNLPKYYIPIWFPEYAEYARHPIIMLIYWVGIIFVISSISWFLFEKPLNSLKKHFPYYSKTPKGNNT